MTVLTVLGLIIALFSFREFVGSNVKRYGVYISIFICMAIATIRTSELGDLAHYKEIFEYTDWRAVLGIEYQTYEVMSSEFLYKLLNYVCHKINSNFHFFLFVEALIVNILLLLYAKDVIDAKKESTNNRFLYCYSTFMFMFYFMGMYNVIIIRQTISVAICLFSIKYIRKKEFLKFFACFLMAFLLHRATIVWFPAFWIFNLKTKQFLKRCVYIVILLLGMFGTIVITPYIAKIMPGMWGAKINLYLMMGNNTYGQKLNVWIILLKSLINCIFIFVCSLILIKYYKNDKNYMGYFNLYVCSMAITLVSPFISNQFARMATPYAMTHTALIIYLLSSKFANCFTKVMIFILVVVYYFLRFKLAFVGIQNFETMIGVLI